MSTGGWLLGIVSLYHRDISSLRQFTACNRPISRYKQQQQQQHIFDPMESDDVENKGVKRISKQQ